MSNVEKFHEPRGGDLHQISPYKHWDDGMEIPWMPMIKKHNNRSTVQQRTTEGTATRQNNGTIGGSKCTNHS